MGLFSMCRSRSYFVLCIVFSIWTIVQTIFHLVFIVYSYYLSLCATHPTKASTIFYYITYFYQRTCKTPILEKTEVFVDISSTFSFENIFDAIFKSLSTKDDVLVLEANVNKLLANTNVFPTNSPLLTKAKTYLLSYIIADGLWIISAMALLMGTCFAIKERLSLLFYGPFLFTTACVSILDVVVTFHFGLDLSETTNFSNWLKYAGIPSEPNLKDLDAVKTSIFMPMSPPLAICIFSSRLLIIWIINIFGLIYVAKATTLVYKQHYRSKSRPRIGKSDSPDTATTTISAQVDLNSSAARIRSWQQFYGAIESTSSASRDLNSNRQNVKVELEEIAHKPSRSNTFYYAYSDVADHIEDRGGGEEGPWSYEDRRRKRMVRVRSDTSISSGTEL